ncbi:MAG TPA: DCC1-like thiol-disulfide oxidoreductase family protein [Polyangiaceae bacterium]|nr:DCC1-like thiol-disulfide oxidoreductase family protein [Polyangiaceae bacterium]
MTAPGQPRDGAPHSRLIAHLANCYVTADARWLGVFRICFGIVLLCDLGRRWVEAREYYTNEGFLPNHFSLFRPMGDHLFSLFHAFSTLPEIHVAFALTGLVFISYTLGFKTKLSQVLAALLMTSLNSRNLMVENGGDVVVNLLSVITAFLPLGRRFSIDALVSSMRVAKEGGAAELNDRNLGAPSSDPVISMAVPLLLLQLAVIYFFNAVHKSGQGWKDASAIHYFLYQDRIVTDLGIFIREHVPQSVLRAFTRSTLLIEHLLPVLIISPLAFDWTRRLGFLLAVGLHGGIALTSRLGPFSYVMVVFFLLFFGEGEYRIISRWFASERRKRTVIYDADCGICLWLARLAKRFDPFARLTFVGNDAHESFPPGVDAALTERTLVVVDAKGRVHEEEQAVRSLLSALPGGWLLGFWLMLPGLRQLGRLGYRWFAARRMAFSQKVGLGACGVPAKPAAVRPEPVAPPRRTWRGDLLGASGFVREVLLALLAATLLAQIVSDNNWIHRRLKVGRAPWMVEVVDRLRLLEGWGMFAPEPPYEDGHIVVDARTKDGRKLDPFTGTVPNFNPEAPHGWGHEQFWCDYSLKLSFPWFSQHRNFFREYLVHWHEYFDRPQDQLVAFDVWWVHDKSPKPGQTHGEPLSPQKLISFGAVKDSGAREWLQKKKPPAKPAAVSAPNAAKEKP